jgi:hypothetical protein
MAIQIMFITILLWVFFAIIIPFIVFPNYLIKPKINKSKKIIDIANKLKNNNKEKL